MRPTLIALAVATLSVISVPSAAHAVRDLDVGLTDSVFGDPNAATRDLWFDRAVDARSDLILLAASWRGIAPANPLPGFDATDPNDPQYNFGQVDAAVADAASRGFQVAVLVTSAPDWAEGENRPNSADPGTWKPNPGAIEDFGHAIAERYEGTVGDFQLWAEPNLTTYLTPQFESGSLVAAAHYRKMITAFDAGVKAVSEDNTVITGGTAPYGDPIQGGNRTPPVAFWRKVLCLRGNALKPSNCPDPARFDVLAHHPINVGAPTRHARNSLDASTPDIGRIERVLRKAERTGRVGPGGHHDIWATEIWWDSKPPDPNGVPQAKHARWLAQSFYLLWKQGVSKVVWFQIRDQQGDFASTPQTGLFEYDGTEKKAFQAFRFPFVADALKGKKVRVWGLAPSAGQVEIERRHDGDWKTVKQLSAAASRVFSAVIEPGAGKLRARFGSETSISWSPG